MLTNRTESASKPGASNQGYGVDGIFNFFSDLTLGGYYSRTSTTDVKGDDESYQARVDYSPDLYGVQFEQVKVGDTYNPEIGFLRRRAFDSLVRGAALQPAAEEPEGDPADHHDRRRRIHRGQHHRPDGVEIADRALQRGAGENSDQFSVEGGTNYELLPGPFNVATGVIIPPGGYNFNDVTFRYAFGQQRRMSGTVAYQTGEFYDGTIHAVTVSGARVSVMTRLSVEPSVSVNDVTLPYGDFRTTVLRARSDYAFSPRMFRQRPRAVQLQRPHLQQQLPFPLGVPAGQRAVRGLHRRARHGLSGLPRASEPRVRGEDQPAAPLLRIQGR
jgi:hypothetical protein